MMIRSRISQRSKAPRHLCIAIICVAGIVLNIVASRGVAFDEPSTSSATSGRTVTLSKERTVPAKSLCFQDETLPMKRKSKWPKKWKIAKKCEQWGAITTIFPVTNATRLFSQLPGWCLVVTGDRKGPFEYNVDNVFFLSAKDQEAENIPLVNKMPWNHFARKNVAYMFAIANGAKYIWDFDDDNAFDSLERASKQLERYTSGDYKKIHLELAGDCPVLNPYPLYTANNVWPRGYPLELIKSASCELRHYCIVTDKNTWVGIWQSLANHDPDVDAILRLTQPHIMEFDKSPGIVVVDNKMYSPMNAQAALFEYRAFWSLFLPTTVHGRVSDIWRSYIGQTIGRIIGMEVSFMDESLVEHYRNAHTYLADFDAELPLYAQAGALVDYLRKWEYDGEHVPGALERLYIDLYERNILKWEDVERIQIWLSALISVGYQFPELIPAPTLDRHCEGERTPVPKKTS